MKQSDIRSHSLGRDSVLAVLVVVAFLAPGAWVVRGLPPVAWSQVLQAVTLAAWLIAAGLGAIALKRPDRCVVLAASAFGVVALVALLANPYPFAAFFYDIYGEMPAMQWFLLLGMFLVGVSLPSDTRVVRGLQGVIAAATVLAIFAIWWSTIPVIGGKSVVFGSSAYSVPALAPVIVIALMMASLDKKRRYLWWFATAIIAYAVAISVGSTMGTIAVVFIPFVILAFEPSILGVPDNVRRLTRWIGAIGATVAVVAVLVASVPALSSSLLPENSAARWGTSVASRIHLYNGAERMFAQKPLLGYGSGGYRLHAVEFLDARVFPSIATLGADPISYSPPSPHSLLWEILTRTGVGGMIAFVILLAVGFAAYRDRLQEGNERQMRFRGALAAAAAVYLFTLLVTPVHFASGLLGPLLCGLALAPNAAAPVKVRSTRETSDSGIGRFAFVAGGIAIAAIALWVGIGKSTGALDGPDLPALIDRADAAASITPGDPLNERHRLELALIAAGTPEEIRIAQESIDRAPGYITDYLPNLALWSYIGLSEIDRGSGMTSEWEAANLERAAKLIPDVPSVVAEQMHLALIEQDRDAVRALYDRVEALTDVYPEAAAYLERADTLLALGG